MKKIYFSLLAAVAALTVNAQYDIEVTLDNPTSGATGVTASETFEIDFTVTNNGPNDVPQGDTLFLAIIIPGVGNYSLDNGANGSVSIVPLQMAFASGASISTQDLGGSAVIDLQNKISGPTDVCVYATVGEVAFASGNDPDDTDMANNTDCFEADNDYTSAEELTENVKFEANIYPNPASETISIDVNQTSQVEKVNFYNAMGQLVTSQEITSANTTVNVGSMAEGFYTYQIVGQNGEVLKVDRLSIVK